MIKDKNNPRHSRYDQHSQDNHCPVRAYPPEKIPEIRKSAFSQIYLFKIKNFF